MKNYAEVICLLDRSGSMKEILDESIGGFNNFLDEQKSIVNDDLISLYLFDDRYDVIYEGIKISDAPHLTEEIFRPRGFTALYDSIARTINSVGDRLSKMDDADRPEKVIFVILTDGKNNRFMEFDLESVSSMIKHQTDKYSWQFLFLAANQDAFAGAKSMGVKSGGFQFSTTIAGSTRKAFDINSQVLYSARSMSKTSYDNSVATGDIYKQMNLADNSDAN